MIVLYIVEGDSERIVSLKTVVYTNRILILPMIDNNKQQTTNNKAKNVSVKSYKDFIVYQKAKQFTINLIKYFSGKKLNWTEKYLIDQLIRTAASSGANLSEGYGRHHKKDYRRFISISRGSSFELEYWLDLLGETKIVSKEFLNNIDCSNKEVIKMLSTMMKNLDK